MEKVSGTPVDTWTKKKCMLHFFSLREGKCEGLLPSQLVKKDLPGTFVLKYY